MLWDWLAGVPELRGHLRHLPVRPGPEELGAGTDLVIALVSNLVSEALVTALQIWLTDRASSRATHQTTITVIHPDGHTLTLTTTDPATAAQALRDLLAPPAFPGLGASGDQPGDPA
jgi:hypothetical protein